MALNAMDITPVMKVKNEDYWIYYVLRDALETFGRFIILDTGSTDYTKDIIKATAEMIGADVRLIEENYGDDAHKIGNSPNVLREACPTEWMFLVDGDEIWRKDQLQRLLDLSVADDKLVIMTVGRNLTVVSGRLMEREKWSADRLFRPSVRWDKRTDYPFESHDLEEKLFKNQVQYTDAYFWHTRHLTRSSRDTEAFFRARKRGYFPYSGPYYELPPDWLGELGPFPNPYVGVRR